jgi:putative Mg2+ transporter-C (MgtC) family protein
MLELFIIPLKLLLAILLGGIIGIERERMGKPAGSRTYALIALASTLFTVLSVEGFGAMANSDPSRIAGQILVGLGFIGAGIIIFHRQNEQIEGLTTAAALWATAAVGMAIGINWYFVAVVSSVFIFLILFIVRKVEFNKKKKNTLWDLFEKK